MLKTTYQWQINELECSLTEQQIVSKVHWSLIAKRGEYQCNCFGEIELDYENNSTFIEYSKLTEEIVLNWVKENLKDTVNEEKHLKKVLSTRLSELENSVTLELPWSESQE